MSRTVTPLPSMCAAIPIRAPMVTTPVPPTPVISMPYGFSVEPRVGAGGTPNESPLVPAPVRPRPFLTLPPSTDTKLGQKPFSQE